VDQAASLHEAIIQRKKTLGRPALLGFLDIKAAYDSVDREKLWNKLIRKGASKELVTILMALFSNNESCIVVNGRKSEPLKHPMGLMQGSIISPVLYSIFVDDLAGELRKKSRGSLGGTSLMAFFYADDIALVADDEVHMQELLDICEGHAQKNGYRFAPQKCELITPQANPNCHLYGQRLRRVETFTYLGVVFDIEGINGEQHIARNSAKFMKAVHMFRPMGLNGLGLTGRAKVLLIRTFLRPILEYGMGIIKMGSRLLQKLQVPMNATLRYMLSTPRNTSSEALHTLAGLESMHLRYRTMQAKWMARVLRAPLGTMVREALVAHCQRRLHDSIFQEAFWKNSLLNKIREEDFWTCPNEINWKARIKEASEAEWEGEKERHLNSRILQRTLTSNYPAPQVMDHIEKSFSRRNSKKLLLWIVGRPFGKPMTCLLCGNETATSTHVQRCTGLPIDLMMRQGKFTTALKYIFLAEQQCLGKSAPKVIDYETELAALAKKTRR